MNSVQKSTMPLQFLTHESHPCTAKYKADAYIHQQALLSCTPGVPMATVDNGGGAPSGEGAGGLPDKVACAGIATDLLPSSSSSSGYSLDVSGKTTGEDNAKTEEDEDMLLIDLGVDHEDNIFYSRDRC